MKAKLIFVLGLALAIMGCQGGPTVSSPPDKAGQASLTSTTGASTGTSDSAATSGSTGTTPAQPVASVPDSLKTDAYHWFGLANDKPLKINISSDVAVPNAKIPASGTQTTALKSVADGKAVFDINRDGDIAENFGSETVSLEKDGIYTIKSAQISDTVRNLELPSKLPVGATWKNSGKYNVGKPNEIAQDQTFKVIGEQKVTTLAGPEDALLVTSSGTLTLQGKKSRMTSSLWYVKDKGLVKSVLTVWNGSDPKEKPRTITIQEAK